MLKLILIFVFCFLAACKIPDIPLPDKYKKKPGEKPSETPSPVLVETPEPVMPPQPLPVLTPAPTPVSAAIDAPSEVKAGVPFNVLVKVPEGFTGTLKIMADGKYLLGHAGWNHFCKCRSLHGVKMNAKGEREISAVDANEKLVTPVKVVRVIE